MEPIIHSLNSRTHQHLWLPASTENGEPDRVVLIFPTWAGSSDFEQGIARRLNQLGMHAVVIDPFGAETELETIEQRQQAMGWYLEDMTRLTGAISSFVAQIMELPQAQGLRLMTSGYCFGGLCSMLSAFVLEKVEACASFHGLMKVPAELQPMNPDVRLLIMNGYRDPMVAQADLATFLERLDALDMNWATFQFGKAMHSFALPHSNMPKRGVCFDSVADRRAWNALVNFLDEQ